MAGNWEQNTSDNTSLPRDASSPHIQTVITLHPYLYTPLIPRGHLGRVSDWIHLAASDRAGEQRLWKFKLGLSCKNPTKPGFVQRTANKQFELRGKSAWLDLTQSNYSRQEPIKKSLCSFNSCLCHTCHIYLACLACRVLDGHLPNHEPDKCWCLLKEKKQRSLTQMFLCKYWLTILKAQASELRLPPQLAPAPNSDQL